MISPPRTQEEARAYRYRQWAGCPNGVAYQEGRCAYELAGAWRPAGQCSRRLPAGHEGHGRHELYCRQHARMLAEREASR